jgi:hypothetical protein
MPTLKVTLVFDVELLYDLWQELHIKIQVYGETFRHHFIEKNIELFLSDSLHQDYLLLLQHCLTPERLKYNPS